MDALSTSSGLFSLAQTSDFFCPVLDLRSEMMRDGTHIVVGDSIDDRMIFWNLYHRFPHLSFSEIAVLRLSSSHVSDNDFLARVRKILERREVC